MEAFLSKEQKKTHTLGHLRTKTCQFCNNFLVQIADEWYMSHGESQCKRNATSFHDMEFELQIGRNDTKSEESNDEEVIPNVLFDNSTQKGIILEKSNDNERSLSTQMLQTTQHNQHNKNVQNHLPHRKHLKRAHTNADKRMHKTKPECSICGQTFASIGNLNLHKNIHSDVKRFNCNHCGRGFNQYNHLKEHLNAEEGRRPWKCKLCPKSFIRQPQLKVHQRVHTREKPFKCTIDRCERAYAHEIDLKRHKFGAHGIYTKRHICSFCEKVYPENKLLKRHMQSQHKSDVT